MAIAARESRGPGFPSAPERDPDAPGAPGVRDRGPLPSRGVARRLATGLLRRGRPLHTVRLRLALFYGGLFFVSGAALLAITYFLVVISTPSVPLNSVLGSAAAHVAFPIRGAIDDQRAIERHVLLSRSGVALLIMTVLSVLLGWLTAGRVLRPLRVITATTRQLSEENLHERLSLDGPNDELKLLGDTIDGLLNRLEAAFEAQRAFVASASHELRTPLTGIRVSIDVASRRASGTSPDALVLAQKVREDLDQANRLLESFLLLARAQRGAITDLERVSLAKLAGDALEVRAPALADCHLRVTATLADAAVVGNEVLLARLVANLIDNAVRHNQEPGFIQVTTKADDDLAYVVVENGGPLLDQERVDQLAQPFKRLGLDRTGSENGLGLGLAIVAAIANAHGGSLDLRARSEGGLAVTVALPLRPHGDDEGQ
jgi:signal transduction histidine kinase